MLDLIILNRYIINMNMTSKEIAIKNIQNIPDSPTWADIVEERIRFLSSMDKDFVNTKSEMISQQQQEIKESLKQLLSK